MKKIDELIEMIKDDGLMLQQIPSSYMTTSMCAMAVKQNAWALQFVPAKFINNIIDNDLINLAKIIKVKKKQQTVVVNYDDIVVNTVVKAIEENRQGFRNGWISSKALDDLLKDVDHNIPINKRRDFLNSIGYDWHPHLNDGRVNNNISHEGGKPRLFVCLMHPSLSIESPAEVVKQYIKDQGYVDKEFKLLIDLITIAIDEGRQGFRNGWISSIKLEQLIKEEFIPGLANNQRRKLMNLMGYDWHPVLADNSRGKLNSLMSEEGGYPVLFTNKNHHANVICSTKDIRDKYREDQGYSHQVRSTSLSHLTKLERRSRLVSIANGMIKDGEIVTIETVTIKACESLKFANLQFIDDDELIANAKSQQVEIRIKSPSVTDTSWLDKK